MGTWTEDNFGSDAALDYVQYVYDQVGEQASDPYSVTVLETFMAALEIQLVLVKHCGAGPPDVEDLESLKKSTLEIYDKEIDSLEPDADYKVKRRGVIEETFDNFIELAKEES